MPKDFDLRGIHLLPLAEVVGLDAGEETYLDALSDLVPMFDSKVSCLKVKIVKGGAVNVTPGQEPASRGHRSSLSFSMAQSAMTPQAAAYACDARCASMPIAFEM